MSRIGKLFTDHPASVGETYAEHMRMALGFSVSLCRAALCCGIHAFLPFLFQRTGSRAIEDLHCRMIRHRSKLDAAPDARDRQHDAAGHGHPHAAA